MRQQTAVEQAFAAQKPLTDANVLRIVHLRTFAPLVGQAFAQPAVNMARFVTFLQLARQHLYAALLGHAQMVARPVAIRPDERSILARFVRKSTDVDTV